MHPERHRAWPQQDWVRRPGPLHGTCRAGCFPPGSRLGPIPCVQAHGLVPLRRLRAVFRPRLHCGWRDGCTDLAPLADPADALEGMGILRSHRIMDC